MLLNLGAINRHSAQEIIMTIRLSTLYGVAILLLFGATACSTNSDLLHKRSGSNLPDNVAIQGFSAVSYFEKGIAERGSSEFTALHDGRIYYLASADQVETFSKNPDRYVPRFGEYCPYSLALGRRVNIDPSRFKIHDDKLLLFHSRVELDTLDVTADAGVYEKADKQFELLRF